MKKIILASLVATALIHANNVEETTQKISEKEAQLTQLQADQSLTHDNPPPEMVFILIGDSPTLRCSLSVCQAGFTLRFDTASPLEVLHMSCTPVPEI